MKVTAIPINCTLKRSDVKNKSSTDAMIAVLKAQFEKAGVKVSDTIRIADHNILPGVTSDEGKGDAWPELRKTILAHDILIFGGPIWLGQVGSIAKRVLERMDAFLEETDDKGHMPSFGKVAVAAIVGNEDGAHGSSAQLFQALNDLGWTIPSVAACYWVGEAMSGTDFVDLKSTPRKVTETAKMVAANAAHIAGLLKDHPYP
jgi:multimeric flavodoxin WrbA